MKNFFSNVFAVIAALFVFTASSSAAPFDQLFKLTKINGDCLVMVPDSSDFVAATEGKLYPYGSKIKTGGRKSSAVIEFSAGNSCRVLANTVLVVSEDAKDKKLKTLKLDEGQVGVELEEKFHESNSLNVETAAAICGAIGCKFTVSSRLEKDFKVIVIVCEEGTVKIWGADYDIPLLEKEEAISIAIRPDKDFTRIKNIKGSFSVTLKNSQGEAVPLELKLGSSIKIYREVSPAGNNMFVYIIALNSEGKTDATFTYNRPLQPGIDVIKPDTKPGEESADGEIPVITTTTTSTTSTTTTTLPPSDLQALQHTTTGTTIVGGETPTPPRPTPTPVGNR